MSRPTRGGADSIKFMGGGSRPATMTVMDVDAEDPTVFPDSWFVYALAVQTGVEMLPTMRFGHWENKPKIIAESDLVIIGDIDNEAGDNTEPVLIVTPHNSVTIFVGQAKHLESKPFPVPRQPEPGAMTG